MVVMARKAFRRDPNFLIFSGTVKEKVTNHGLEAQEWVF